MIIRLPFMQIHILRLQGKHQCAEKSYFGNVLTWVRFKRLHLNLPLILSNPMWLMDIDAMLSSVKDALHAAVDNSVHSKLGSIRFNQPWISHEIKQLARQKKRAYNKARKSQSPTHWSKFLMLQKLMQTKCRAAYGARLLCSCGSASTVVPRRT